MGKILKTVADVLSGDTGYYDAWVEVGLGSPQSELWITFGILVTAAQIAFWETANPGDPRSPFFVSLPVAAGPFATVGDQVYLGDDGVNGFGWRNSYGSAAPPPAGGAWVTVEYHYKDSVAQQIYADGVLVVDLVDGGDGSYSYVRMGQDLRRAVVDPDPVGIIYFKDVKIGTTRGASDLFADDFASGDLSLWDVTSGDVSIVDEPAPPLLTPQGVCVAFDAPTLEPNPTWTRLDDPQGYNLVQEWTVDRGRNAETDHTDPGTAAPIKMRDFDGIIDPTNAGGPFYGKLAPTKQVAVALQNPVTLEWSTIYRGFAAEWLYDVDITEKFISCDLDLVDLFEILAALEMTPGNQGDTVPAGSEGQIFFEGALPPGGGASVYKHVNQRIIQALNDAGVPSEWQRIFSGNVSLLAAIYKRRDELLQVIQDAGDAEGPGVFSNVYTSKEGVLTFHGRFARFFPERPGYGINTWKAGDAQAVALDPDVAPISQLGYRISRNDIINAALNLPQGVDITDVPGALVTDPTSIATHGWRFGPGSADNLLTYRGHDEAGDPTDAVTETKRFSTYYVDNYKNPRARVSKITFRPKDPQSSSNPAALWALICGVELGDIISLKTTHPGGGGFDEDFFVEHIRYTATPLRADFPDVTLELDVSPRSYFESNPFGEIPDNDDMAGAFTLPGAGGTTAGNSVGFSNEANDPVAATSKDPIVETWSSLFTGPGGAYGDENADTHNFRTAWFKWTAPGDWTGSSSFGVTLHGQTAVSALLMVKPGPSGVPPDNGDFTALGAGGAVNTPGDKSDLTQTETGDAHIAAGGTVYIGVGSLEDGGEDFDLTWAYTP